jgi:hypothetical protein
MAGRKIFVNVFRSRSTIMASKIVTTTSMNSRQQIDNTFVQGPTPELLRVMKNVREWKKVKTNWNILGLLKTKNATMETFVFVLCRV